MRIDARMDKEQKEAASNRRVRKLALGMLLLLLIAQIPLNSFHRQSQRKEMSKLELEIRELEKKLDTLEERLDRVNEAKSGG